MNEDKTQELLLQLLSDMSYVKAKLDNIEAMKLSSRIDLLEAQAKEQARVIETLENRSNTLEEYVRSSLLEKNKTHVVIWTSLGVALFSSILSIIFNIISI